jgi:hypothetical protein
MSAEQLDAGLGRDVLAWALHDDEHAPLICQLLEPEELAASPILRVIFSKAKAYTAAYNKAAGPHLPTLLEKELNGENAETVALYEETLADLQAHCRQVNAEFVVDCLTRFKRQQQLEKALTQALKAKDAGRIADAEKILRQIVHDAAQPTRVGDDADALLLRDLPEVRWIVQDVLPEGLTLLVSRPKNKKTLSAMHIAEAVRRGVPVFGFFPTNSPGGVLFLALEDNERRIKKRLCSITKSLYRHPPLHKAEYHYTWPRGDVAGLRRYLDEHPDVRLVVVDTLQRFRVPQGRNGNSYAEDYLALGELQRLAADKSIAILVLHHSRKAGAEDITDEVSGTTGLAGAADAIWILRRQRGTDTADLFVTGRDIEEEATLALRWDSDTTAWAVVGMAEDVRVSSERQAVLDALGDREMTAKEILLASGGRSMSGVYQLLQRMLDDGLLQQNGRKYRKTSRERN